MGFNTLGMRAAVEMCGVDRVVYGSDYGPLPYGIKEHVQMVEDVLPNPADQQLVLSETSSRIFRLGLADASPALAANGSV
jgi:predicted TIM-barrel fold metal-dependent hydrolase